jgi:MazG family protein
MDRLREPGGCPWDQGQSHESLAPYLSEEAAEVLDAIAGLEPGDEASEGHLCEELGDLMLQVAFHARLAQERGAFDLSDVEAGIVQKLLRRHPHVFGEGRAEDAAEVLSVWQDIKKREKGREDGLLDGAKADISSLAEAMEIGRACEKVGFDWPDVGGVLEKVREEIDELSAEFAGGGAERMEEELGDVLFSLVQWARHLNIDPDMALRRQMGRFRERFRHVEALAKGAGGWGNVDLGQMEGAWHRAKGQGSGG